jgi:hypothetical protein
MSRLFFDHDRAGRAGRGRLPTLVLKFRGYDVNERMGLAVLHLEHFGAKSDASLTTLTKVLVHPYLHD